jgi:hypothetical protein
LYALVQRGLFDLYELTWPETIDRIVRKIVGKLPPAHPPVIPVR